MSDKKPAGRDVFPACFPTRKKGQRRAKDVVRYDEMGFVIFGEFKAFYGFDFDAPSVWQAIGVLKDDMFYPCSRKQNYNKNGWCVITQQDDIMPIPYADYVAFVEAQVEVA
jgi:hypothetical protein